MEIFQSGVPHSLFLKRLQSILVRLNKRCFGTESTITHSPVDPQAIFEGDSN